MRAGGIVIFAGMLLLILALAGSLSGKTPPPPGAAPETSPGGRGGEIYAKRCSPCHGMTGGGDGEMAYLLQPKPRNFRVADFRLVSTKNGVPTDEDLLKVVSRGMPGSAMPPWAHLSREDLDAVVGYVRELVKKGIRERLSSPSEDEEELTGDQIERAVVLRTTPGEAVSVPAPTEGTPEELARGKEVYGSACASCHGEDGRGQGIDLRYTTEGHPILPRDFTAGIFKGSADPRDLFIRIRAGMPGTPMPSSDLGDEDVWAVVHYVRSLVKEDAQARSEVRRLDLPARRAEFSEAPGWADPVWEKAPSSFVALMPLWWRTPRAEGIDVKALHNGDLLAIRLTWRDPSPDRLATAPQDFPDAAAMQFSLANDPPFFGMGGKGEPVNIWAWKAVRQEDIAKYPRLEDRYPGMVADRYASEKGGEHGEGGKSAEGRRGRQDATFITGRGAGNPVSMPAVETPVEDLNAGSPGTLTFQPTISQEVRGKGEWIEGEWRLVLHRSLATKNEGDAQFTPGKTASVAFAIWDGSAGDRNGQKSVSIWHRLTLE